MSNTLERTIELYLTGQVESAGGECLKWTGHRGVPDRLVFLNGWIVPVEVKSPTGKLDPHQKRMHKRLFMTGIEVVTVSTKEQVDEVIGSIMCDYCACEVCEATRKLN